MTRSFSQDDSFDLGWLRSAIDLAICFVMAVIMLRCFVLEGYLISTGSMAPGLLGFHRRITCPSCQFEFAFGVSFDDSVETGTGTIVEPEGPARYATCPNCGQINIDVSGVPNSHGDQLLVQKHVYDLRKPRRWETVVFRNPASPGEAYVKRVVGLPGERIQIINGDVYIGGKIARKNYPQQQAMRIPVCDLHYLADAEDWQLPWDLDDGWQADHGALKCRTSGNSEGTRSEGDERQKHSPTDRGPQNTGIQWIRFRHWRWFGGHHVAETPLSINDAKADWKSFVDRYDSMPVTWASRVEYDEERQVLRCEGVMPEDLQRDLLLEAASDEFRRAVYRLAALSHLTPVTDRYGYNAMVSSQEYIVSDLMLQVSMEWLAAPKAIHLQIPVGSQTFGLVVHPQEGTVDLISLNEKSVIRTGRYERRAGPEAAFAAKPETLQLEVSNIDRQVLVALNGMPCFEAFAVASEASPEEALEASVSTPVGQKIDSVKASMISLRLEQQKRWALGISGGETRLTDLQVFRDVFYTPGRRRNAIDSEFSVPEDSYFVQGDNSPVSSDSRNWANPSVPHKMLIGKPFLVHLPSRPAVLQFAGREWPIRIPDWSRIRYIQ
jgi:signal peptidase I